MKPEPVALAVERRFRQLVSRRNLWPGFDPIKIPAALFDEAESATYLFRHPAPPKEFLPISGVPEALIYSGRWSGVSANTSGGIAGVGCALMILPRGARAEGWAATLVHEAFHVFQRAKFPGWAANEADLFIYPFDRLEGLARRAQETRALRRALSTGRASDIAEALAQRRARFAALDASSVAYERLTELNEGLAQFVEGSVGGRKPMLKNDDFPAEEVRLRAYATGQALALLLERLEPSWKEALSSGEAGSLDELLALRLKCRGIALPEASADPGASRIAAKRLADWSAEQRRKKAEFDAQSGWRVEIRCTAPLFPQGFDPLNVVRLGKGEVLHARFLKLGDGRSTLEVLGAPALTMAAGEHPLFNGVSSVVVAGLSARPKATEGERRMLNLSAPELTASLASPQLQAPEAVRTLRLTLPAAK